MPISPIVLQRRHAELGRIRLGQKNPDRGFPMKLSSFRFTSPNERYIHDLAELYGGTAQPWDNNGKPEHEVFTTATTLPVYVVKGGLSQWMETWSGGGIVHRCDGEKQADGTPCDPEEWIEVKEKGKPKRLYVHRDAKPTTRLSVMLPELDAIGVWRMETKGWNAAAEIPAVAELAQFVGELVPAELHLVERRTVKDGQTSRFVVPVLDLRIGQARLREIVQSVSSGALELGGGQEPRAISATREATSSADATSAPSSHPVLDYRALAGQCRSVDDVRVLWKQTADAGHLSDELRALYTARVEAIKAEQTTPAAAAGPVEDIVDGEILDEHGQETMASNVALAADVSNPDAIWQQILAATGQLGWTLDQTNADFVSSMGGLKPEEASGEELAAYLKQVTTGEAVAS